MSIVRVLEMAEEATYRLACRCTFRCPCGRTLEKRYPWDVVVCVCGYEWGEDKDIERTRKKKRRVK